MFIHPFQKSNLAMVHFGLQVVFMNLFSLFTVLVFVFAIEAFHDVSNVMWCNVVLKKRSSYHRWFQQVLASTNTVAGYRLIFLQYKIPMWHRKGQCWKVEWQFGVFFCMMCFHTWRINVRWIFHPSQVQTWIFSRVFQIQMRQKQSYLCSTIQILFCHLVSKQLNRTFFCFCVWHCLGTYFLKSILSFNLHEPDERWFAI